MASNTDTLPIETGTTTGEAPRPPGARRGAFTWGMVADACIAPVALAVATLVAGDEDSDIRIRQSDPQAERYPRPAPPDRQAKTGGLPGGAVLQPPAGEADQPNPSPSGVPTRPHEVIEARPARSRPRIAVAGAAFRARISGRHQGGSCRRPVPAGGSARAPGPIGITPGRCR
jgi:hypothetical protein